MKNEKPLSEVTTDELKALIRSRNTINYVVGSIFLIIIMAWVFLGYWEENTPVFISTIALGISASVAIYGSSFGLRKELANRQKAEGTADGGATR